MAESRSELRLILLAQCDDPEAVKALLLRVHDCLLRYIAGLVGPSHAADVLQNVFLKICRNLQWLRRPELFRPWAYRIAGRACFEYLKRERRWSGRYEDETPVEDLPDSGRPGSSELIADLEPWLDRLSPASRAVLLHYGRDLSIEETAAILDIGVGTAKSRLAYGLACLRKSTRKKG